MHCYHCTTIVITTSHRAYDQFFWSLMEDITCTDISPIWWIHEPSFTVIIYSNEEEWGLTSKIESWWSTQADINDMKGVLFTNEFAINSETYAQRRAMKNDEDDINVWKNHMHLSGIDAVSPGLLFIETQGIKRRQRGKWLQHKFIPKSSLGSIWTPHNYYAVDFTRRILQDLFW